MTKPQPSAVITALTGVLADTYALAVKTHAAHWNVTGPGFFELHAAFATQYTALFAAADELAERLRALDQVAPQGIAAIAGNTRISDLTISAGPAIVTALRADHRAVATQCRTALATAQAAGDDVTVDMLIARADAHDQTAWMLSAWATN